MHYNGGPAKAMLAGNSVASDHIPYLDGVRGLAALWVFLGHVQILSGMSRLPLLSYGGLAVDLFMIMSGMLMSHHYLLRQQHEPWKSPRTWITFWIRRLFRIAPLYYFLLIVALLAGPVLGNDVALLEHVWPQIAVRLSHYADRTAGNILMHLTFVFGVMPAYSIATPLPDWSIGLEMEFYATFPFLMLLIARIGAPVAAITLVTASIGMSIVFAGFFNQFVLPSLLPMKLYMFLCGILIAVGRWRHSIKVSMMVSVSCSLVYAMREHSAEAVARVLMVAAVFYLLHDGSLPSSPVLDKIITRLRGTLGGRMGRFLGDTSYSVYLLHWLILVPVAAYLATTSGYVELHGSMRFCMCLVVSGPLVYAASWLLHQFIERPGIRLGRTAARHFNH